MEATLTMLCPALRKTMIVIAVVIIGAALALALIGWWFTTTFAIWQHYGSDSMIWWVMGSALTIALALVALW